MKFEFDVYYNKSFEQVVVVGLCEKNEITKEIKKLTVPTIMFP